MFAHKIIDAVAGTDKALHLDTGDHPRDADHMKVFAAGVARADKFEFTNIPFEALPDNCVKIPSLTQTEREIWVAGLLPLPAMFCYYEFLVPRLDNYMQRYGLLVAQPDANAEEGTIRLTFERACLHGNTVLMIGRRTSVYFDHRFVYDGSIQMILSKSESEFSKIDSDHGNALSRLIVYMTLMLLSQTTEISYQDAPVKLNKARAKIGRAPLPSHRIVRLVPQRFTHERVGGTGPTGGHRRLHWRRSHIRHFDRQTPKGTHVALCPCCKRENIFIMPIARYLVGKRELGEVTHEYRVET